MWSFWGLIYRITKFWKIVIIVSYLKFNRKLKKIKAKICYFLITHLDSDDDKGEYLAAEMDGILDKLNALNDSVTIKIELYALINSTFTNSGCSVLTHLVNLLNLICILVILEENLWIDSTFSKGAYQFSRNIHFLGLWHISWRSLLSLATPLQILALLVLKGIVDFVIFFNILHIQVFFILLHVTCFCSFLDFKNQEKWFSFQKSIQLSTRDSLSFLFVLKAKKLSTCE